jgi:pimeloyl-ACP methyl ester carboxylesterase
MNTVSEPKLNNAIQIYQAGVTTGQVVSADGAVIGYRQVGSGPGLVILHGGMRAGHHYLRLAQALANRFTVYLPDRRGRGLSGPPGRDYSVETEMDDVRALLKQTGAAFLFGHSAGGFFALEAALRLPLQKLVVYEPAVSIHGSLPFGWVPAYERALAKGDPGLAFLHMVKGLRLSPMPLPPNWMLHPFTRRMLSDADGQEMAALLSTGVWEIREFIRLERLGLTYERYASIAAKTLLIYGTSSPAYLRDAACELSRTIPRAELVAMNRRDHNAPDQNAPEQVAAELKRFL